MTPPDSPPAVEAQQTPGRQRLDKWLWFARVIKTRSLAARLVEEGHVRVNSIRAETPARAVKPGDVLTIALPRQVRVLRVVGPGERRGPFEQARTLYVDLSPPGAATDLPLEGDEALS